MEKPNSTKRVELDHMLEKLLQEMKNPKLDKSDILYSRRCRGRVISVLNWMLNNGYVDEARAMRARARYCRSRSSRAVLSSNDDIRSDDDISVLRKAITALAESISDSGLGFIPFHQHLFYPLNYVHVSHDGPTYVDWRSVIALGEAAFSPMQLFASSNDMMMDSEARNVMSLLYSRGSMPNLIRNRYGRPWTSLSWGDGGEQTGFGPNTFRDKYVLVCCFNVPALFGLRGVQSLFNLCHELSSLERDDVEIVMVARIHILCDEPEFFKHVFKGLPSSCLVVAYEDEEQRERMYKQLGFGAEEFQCFVYNYDGLFLNSFCADGYENPYGAEAFPFTKEMVEKVHRERVALRQGGSLEELLRPSYRPDDVVVYEFNQTRGPKRRISQVIKNKHVGLYVCCNGDLIPDLHKLYEQCKERNKEFEIVVLYLPLLCKMDPEMFKMEMDGLLEEQRIRGWWCLPFNNSVSLRFWGLTKDYDIGERRFHEESEDRLIIVGPDGKIVDMYGAEVIKTHGIDDTYPFTRAAVVKKRMRELRREERLLESLWGARLSRGNNPREIISGYALLKKKKVIIYMGEAHEVYKADDFQRLLCQYQKMKAVVGDEFEMVFVELPIPYLRGAVDARVFSVMPWYIHCPLDGTYTALSEQLADILGRVSALVGFGEDGLIRSVKLLEKLDKTAGLCLENTLFADLYLFHKFNEFRVI